MTDSHLHLRPHVTLIAYTHFSGAPASVPWVGGDCGQDLIEFAGRACYQSWGRPNPATASNEGYLRHILDVGHFSVLEHASATFYVAGVSRSLTHELVRHRHLNYSQLSQRYVDGSDPDFVVPPELADEPEAIRELLEAREDASRHYVNLEAIAIRKLAPNPAGRLGTAIRKRARQAARAVLPNATETRIVVTGNHRAWRHIIRMRASEAADVEIRALAVEMLRQLRAIEPNVYQDFVIRQLPDGTFVAECPTPGEQ